MGKLIDLTGQRFGRLTVISRAGTDNARNIIYSCKCDCGKQIIAKAYRLRNGHTCSCGCLRVDINRDIHKKHGMAHTRLNNIWIKFKQRCLNENNKQYSDYGGRGINVCDEWVNDFEAFYNWATQNGYSDTLTIDRIDNDKGYSPDNCRWADMKTQSNNTRKNRIITYNGETKTLTQWGEYVGISVHVLSDRINKLKWDIAKALTTPVKK